MIDEDCDGEDLTPNALAVGPFSIQVYPNPGADYLQINLFRNEGTVELRHWSTEGRLLNIYELDGNNRIDISGWAVGLSIVEILQLESRQRAYIKHVKLGE